MAAAPVTDVTRVAAIIDEAPVGRLHLQIFVICGLIMCLDGFDLGLLGFVVPAMAAEWSLPPSSFAFALSASLIGVAFGSPIAGAMGDRFGRRTTLLWMFAIGACGSLLTAFCTDLVTLSACRFITGFGMGGTIPNVIALVNEFSPGRRRPFLVVAVYSMAALGSVAASLLAGPLIATWGWQSMFVVGGVLPLAAALLAVLGLPESVRFLVSRGCHPEVVAGMVGRLAGRPVTADSLAAAVSRSAGAAAAAGPDTRLLFAGALRWITPLLWVAFVGTQGLVFFISGWLPTLLRDAGFALETAILATGLFHLGSVLGGLVTAGLAARIPLSGLLALLYLLATASLLVLGSGIRGEMAAHILAFCAGFTVVGASFCLGAFASTCYSDALRARGVGLGLGVGRIGSIASPLIGGAALAAGHGMDTIISTLALPAALCCLAMWLVSRLEREPSRR